MTPSEELIGRYSKIEREADAVGRVIGVKRLKVSQQLKISEMTPSLEGDNEMTSEDGRTVRVSRRSMPIIAASVCEIDRQAIPFPRTRGELDAIMDRLDEEGIIAAVVAFGRLAPRPAMSEAGPDSDSPAGEPEGTVDAAKK